MSNKKITIFSLSDPQYFDMLCSFIKSVNVYFNEANLNITLINCKEKHNNKIKSMHDKIVVKNEQIKFKDEMDKRIYCTNRRSHLFRRAYQEDRNQIAVWIDADCVIKSSCNGFKNHLYDCELTMRPKDLSIGKFAAGVIGLDLSAKNAGKFVEEYDTLTKRDQSSKDRNVAWMSNQANLNVCYHRFKNKMNFKPLDKIYCDVWMTDNGVIWAAKADSKKSKKFIAAMDEINRIYKSKSR